MALTILSQQPKFEENDTDDLLALDFLGDDYEKSLRPSLAEKLQVGFLASDRFTQTEITEIIDVKHMTTTVTSLVTELADLKRDFDFTKQVLKATFEKKLQDKAFELYSKLNDRLRELQHLHEEMVQVVRRSFKQQLQDALVKMATHYKKYYEDRLSGKLDSNSQTKAKSRIASLEMELRMSQSLVQMLQAQIDELKHELREKQSEETIPDTSELDAALEQNKELELEIMRLRDKNDELTEQIHIHRDRISDLEFDVKECRSEMENERELKKKMSSEINDARRKIDAERMQAMKQLDEQKLAMEKDMAAKMAKNEARAADSARETQRQLAELEAVLENRMTEERRKYELKISNLIAEHQQKEMATASVQDLERVVEQQKHEILVLRQRLLKIQKQWEKKFAILKASMHALKDEAYIRMQLQKQAASLKYASVSYGTEAQNMAAPSVPSQPGLGQQTTIGSGKVHSKPLLPANKPLPAITRVGRVLPGRNTVSLPSGVGTDPFPEEDEDDDDLDPEDGFVPLPPKGPNVGDYMPMATKSD